MDENKSDSKKANLLVNGRKIVGRLSTIIELQCVLGGTIDNECETLGEVPKESGTKKSRCLRESLSSGANSMNADEDINSQEQRTWIQAIKAQASAIESLTSLLVDNFDFNQQAHWRESPVSIASLTPLGFAIYFGNLEQSS
jgi:hypothetical protein